MNLTPETPATEPLLFLVAFGGLFLLLAALWMFLTRRQVKWFIPVLLLATLYGWSLATVNNVVLQESKDSVVSALVTAAQDKYGVELTDEEAMTMLGDAYGQEFRTPGLSFDRGHQSEPVSVDINGEARDVVLVWDGKYWLLSFAPEALEELPRS